MMTRVLKWFGRNRRSETPRPREGMAAELKALCATLGVIQSGLEELAVPGTSTSELDHEATRLMRENGVKPSFLGYLGFPAAITASVNNEVINTLPCDRILARGDLLKLQVGVGNGRACAYQGWTYGIGGVSDDTQLLVQTGRAALDAATAQCTCGNRVRNVSLAIQRTVERKGFSVCRDFVGHGIGECLHEAPEIPGYALPRSRRSPQLEAGMTLSIIVLANMGGRQVQVREDYWNVTTVDGSPSVLFSHIVAVRPEQVGVLTRTRPTATGEPGDAGA